MPRFSDIFVWESCSLKGESVYLFKRCMLIKKVDVFEKGSFFNEITFDVSGMFILCGSHGPYCLTV
jgi:hypothetical protein